MINELLLASKGVHALMDLLKATHGLANYNQIEATVKEISAKLVQADTVAQKGQSALATKVDELEKELARLKDWTAEKQSYELKELARGVFAYIQIGFMGHFESAYKLCATCFEQNSKSPLQQENVKVGRRLSLVCHHCKSPIVFDSYRKNS